MLSRALSLATAMLLISLAAPSSFLIAPASAQNLEAGKSPAQLFSANCTVCHKSARGLLKSVPPGELPGFLRQHYTTSSDMAKSISAYLVANGAAGGGRRGNDDGLTRQGRELSREQAPAPTEAAPGDRRRRPAAAERPQAQPGPDGLPAAEQPQRRSRTKRQPPAEAAPAADGQAPAAVEAERPVNQKQKAGKKNRRHQEEPKTDAVKDEPAKSEPAKPEPAKSEPPKSEPPKEAAPAKPAEEPKPVEAPKPEPKAETPPATRSDPVPAVTPAPKEPEPSAPAPASPPPAAAPPSEPAKPAE